MRTVGQMTAGKVVGIGAVVVLALVALWGVLLQEPLLSVSAGLALVFALLVVGLAAHRRIGMTLQTAAEVASELQLMMNMLRNDQGRNDQARKDLADRMERSRAELRNEMKAAMGQSERHAQGLSELKAELVTLRNEHARSFSSVESAQGHALAVLAETFAAQVESVRTFQVQSMRSLESALEGMGGQIHRLDEESHRVALEGHTLVLRGYRDMTALLDTQAGHIEALHTGLEAASTVHKETGRGLQEILGGVSTSQIEANKWLQEIKTALPDLAKQNEVEKVAGIGTRVIEKTVDIETALSQWEKRYGQDKQQLKDFVRNEKQTRKIAQASMQWLKTEIVQEVEALDQLRRLLGVEMPTPLLGGWAMDPVAMLNLVKSILSDKPKTIVELGGGTSTLWMALALQKIGEGKLVSFDHIEGYANATQATISAMGLDEYCEIRLVPLVPTRVGDDQFTWYDIGGAAEPGSIDMLIVDGPPAATGPLARFPAVPRLYAGLAPHAVVVLDDAGRPDEVKIKKKWLEEYPLLQPAQSFGARTEVFRLP